MVRREMVILHFMLIIIYCVDFHLTMHILAICFLVCFLRFFVCWMLLGFCGRFAV